MTRIEEIKAELAYYEGNERLMNDRAELAAYNALRTELAALLPKTERTPADRARWAISDTRKIASEAIISLRLALAAGDENAAQRCRNRIAELRRCIHSFLRDLKAAGAALTPANDRHPIRQIAADLAATCREQRANLERLSASLDQSIQNDERRAQDIKDAGQAVIDSFPAEVLP